MKNFVISLECEHKRRAHINEQFGRQNIPFEFFNAITPQTLDQTKAYLELNTASTTLHPNEVSCLLSHAILWKKAVDNNLDYIAIFEDDIHLGTKAQIFLQNSTWIPTDCEIIKLEKFYKTIGISPRNKIYPLLDGRELLQLVTVHMGGGGYILSQKAAKRLLSILKESQHLIPVDHIIFREYLTEENNNIYQMSPALCIQDMRLKKGETSFPSALEDVRNERKGKYNKKKKLSISEKFNKELLRIKHQIYQFFRNNLKLHKSIKIISINFK